MGIFSKRDNTKKQKLKNLERILKNADTTIKLIDLKKESLYISIEELNQTKKQIEDLKKEFMAEEIDFGETNPNFDQPSEDPRGN